MRHRTQIMAAQAPEDVPPPPPTDESPSLAASEMEDLTALLIEQGLEDYEETLRGRDVTAPHHLMKLSSADVEEIIPGKPVHQRKLLALTRGKGLNANKFTVDVGEPGSPGLKKGPGSLARQPSGAIRSPTPLKEKEGLSPLVKSILDARGQADKEFSRKSAWIQTEERMKATKEAFDNVNDGVLTPSQIMMMMNHVRSMGEKRFVALCSVPYLKPDSKAIEEAFWSKLDEKNKPFAPVMASASTILCASPSIVGAINFVAEAERMMLPLLDEMKAAVPKMRRKSVTETVRAMTPLRGRKGREADRERADSDQKALDDAAAEGSRDMIAKLNMVTEKLEDTKTRLLRVEADMQKAKFALAALKGWNKIKLHEDDSSGDMQVLMEETFSGIVTMFSKLLDELDVKLAGVASARAKLNAQTKDQIDILEKSETYRNMVGVELLSDRYKGLEVVATVPKGVEPGSTFTYNTKSGALIEVTVPPNAVPGTLLTVKLDKSHLQRAEAEIMPKTEPPVAEVTPPEDGAAAAEEDGSASF